MSRTSVDQLDEKFYILRNPKNSALVELTGPQYDIVEGSMTTGKGAASIEHAYWGADNLRPNRILRLVSQNHIKPQLISTARDFLLGGGLQVYQRILLKGKKYFEPTENPEIEDWLEMVEAENYIRSAFYNQEFFGNVFTSISLGTNTKVESIKSWDCTDARCAKRNLNNGQIERYFLNPDWEHYKKENNKPVPAWDRLNPTQHAEFIYHNRDFTPGQSYYDTPAWWGTENWTQVSNKIPKFHISGLDNGYNIKYHIRIPADYFTQFGDEKAQLAARSKLNDEMNKWLAGIDNVDKAFVSVFPTGADGKPIPGFEILAVDAKGSDNAYDLTNTQANTAHVQGHGIDPSLAGIQTGKMVGGSGSEKLISYKLHIALRTPNKRKIVLDTFNKICKPIMGWDRDIFIGIADIDVSQVAPEVGKGAGKTVDQSNPAEKHPEEV